MQRFKRFAEFLENAGNLLTEAAEFVRATVRLQEAAESVSRQPETAAPAPTTRTKPPPARTPVSGGEITLDTKTWGASRTARNGSVSSPPNAPEYDVDNDDRRLIATVRALCDTGMWSRQINILGLHRRLTRQQIRGVIATNTRRSSQARSTPRP